MLGEWKFKPTIGPTLFAVPTFIILILLGSWQVQRMSWKQDIIASFEQQMAKQPVIPPLDIKESTDWRYTRVRATGRFLHDKEILLTGRTFEGTIPTDIVVMEGILRQDNRKGYFVPENEPNNEVWLYVNTKQIAEYRDIGPVPGYYIDELRAPGPYKLPIGAAGKIEVRNEHLKYAVTWFLLAITLLAVYIVYHTRKREDD